MIIKSYDHIKICDNVIFGCCPHELMDLNSAPNTRQKQHSFTSLNIIHRKKVYTVLVIIVESECVQFNTLVTAVVTSKEK